MHSVLTDKDRKQKGNYPNEEVGKEEKDEKQN